MTEVEIATQSAQAIGEWISVEYVFMGIVLFGVGTLLGIMLYRR